ncbi:MAG: hypothetical protein F4X98_06800 [Gammaproteobacteria bacterium]|nr:hypothetical protein [Gammaproteobacteria bacterium]
MMTDCRPTGTYTHPMTEFPLPGAPPRLLDDEAMQDFVREGYVVLKSELPKEFHDRMHDALDSLDERGPRGHNNLLPCVPELALMLDEPVVRGALTSILGRDYYLHFHRHDHFALNNEAQPLHKDGDNHSHNAVDGLRRIHRTRFAMLFYYPQDTPLEKGPTGIVPRSQYVPRRALEAARYRMNEFNNRLRKEIEAEIGEDAFSPRGRDLWRERRKRFHDENPEAMATLKALDEPWESAKIPLLGDAGTVAIVHFDMVHGRYSANTTDLSRHMVKFLFTRDREPTGPTWHGRGSPWPVEDDALAPVWQSTWDWHRAAPPQPCRFQLLGTLNDLDGSNDHAALGAAYTLGTQAKWRSDGLDALIDRFLGDDVDRRIMAAYGLVAAGATGVPRLVEALHSADAELAVRIIDLLGDIGPPAAPALTELTAAMQHQDVNVRRYATEAVGTVAQGTDLDARVLNEPLADDDALVRRNAALATARLAPEIGIRDDLVPALAENLYHWHHHVRGWSIEALQRLGSPAATNVAMRYLAAARWDPMPKSGDTPTGAPAPKGVVKAVTML